MKKILGLIALVTIISAACGGSGAAPSRPAAEAGREGAAPLRARDSVVILFAGDAMQHKGQLACARQKDGTYSYAGCFAGIEPYVRAADYAVINLETTLGEGDFSGYPMFCTPDEYAREIQRAGFDMLLTANNHCLDRRDRGARRTLDVLDALGVDHIGTYRSKAERDSVLPMVVDIGGFKVAMLNYTYGTNGIPVQGNIVVDYIDRARISGDIKRAREGGAELVCVNIHWGTEYRLLPDDYEKTYAQFLLDQGVDIINGGHPHVVQPIKLQANPSTGRNQLLIYSLGNFLSDMRKKDTQGGAMCRVTLKRDADGRSVVASADYIPTFVVRGTAGVSNHRVMVADSVTGSQAPLAAQYLRIITDLYSKHNVACPRAKD